MKPLLFLDVDGVLNVYSAHHERINTEGGPVWIPDGTAERVAKLHDAFEIVWATAWGGSANRTWIDLLALKCRPFDAIVYKDLKLPECIRYAAGRDWAFVDDDADWELGLLGWTRERHLDGSLVINTDTEVGLTDEHVDQLLDFAQSVC